MTEHADKLAEAIRAILRSRMSESPETRDLLVVLAGWVLDEADRLVADRTGIEPGAEPDDTAQESDKRDDDRRDSVPVAVESRGEVPLVFGGNEIKLEVGGTSDELASAVESAVEETTVVVAPRAGRREIDLGLVAERCALKSESCRVYIERRAAEGDPEHEPGVIGRLNSLIDRARRLENCFLWVFWRERAQPTDEEL
ncbi:MAG: hypothetical protein K8E66_00700, partial [Phycisphaerales bacterium]|nr:hypothetical protein [Phycisphaerales bacterium]